MNRKVFHLLIILGVGLFLYFKPFGWNADNLQKAYEGDGIIRPVGKFGTGSGYIINFESFSLAEKFKGNYQVSKVPKLGKDVYLKLRVLMSTEEFKKLKSSKSEMLKSVVKIRAVNSEGEEILNISAPMDEFMFIEVGGKPSRPVELFYFSGDLSKPKSSTIESESWEAGHLKLQLQFIPEVAGFPEGTKGMFFVSCGGYK